MECEFEFRKVENVGKIREVQTVTFLTPTIKTVPSVILQTMASEGWEPMKSDVENGNRFTHNEKTNDYTGKVAFVRFVEVEE